MKKLGVYIAIALGAFGINWMMEAERDSTGAIVSEGSIDAFNMRVGDCFNDTSSATSAEGSSQVSDLPGVPCSSPHDNEVFAVFDVDLPEFPQGDAMSELAFESCLERFEPFVGKDYPSSSLDIMTLYPTEDSWKRQNDREVVCALFDVNANKLVGSAKGLAL